MKPSYRRSAIFFNKLVTESKVVLLMNAMIGVPYIKKVNKLNYVSNGQEAIVTTVDGQQYKITVTPIGK